MYLYFIKNTKDIQVGGQGIVNPLQHELGKIDKCSLTWEGGAICCLWYTTPRLCLLNIPQYLASKGSEFGKMGLAQLCQALHPAVLINTIAPRQKALCINLQLV